MQADQVMDVSDTDSQQIVAKVSPDRGGDLWFTSSLNISDASLRSFVIAGLKQIYQNSMETSLSCWLTPQNSPYERRLTLTRRVEPTAESPLQQPMLLYERAHHLDKAFSVLRTTPLSPAEDAEASKALNIAVLSFASQWSISGREGRDGSPLSVDDKARDSSSLEYQIRRRLYTQLDESLARLSNCTSFRVITARLILFFVSRPLNTEEKNIMHNILSDDGSAPASPGIPDTSQAQGGNLLFELLAAESRADHLRTAIHHLSWWSRRIKLFLKRTSPSQTPGHMYQGPLRQRILQACPHFNLLCWFSVMLDTARSTLHRRPLILDDQGTEALIIRHGADEPTTIYQQSPDEDTKMDTIDENVDAATEISGPSEVWQPLVAKPYSPCDNPFEHPRVDFTKRMGSVLQDATPMTVLIIRKAAHLQAAMSNAASPVEIEQRIADVLDVCSKWDVQYRQFFDNCMIEHVNLPFTVRSWYVMIFGHFLVGVLRAIELIDEHDNDPTVSTPQQKLRLSTSVVLWLQKDYSYKIANMTKVSSLDRTINGTDQTNLHFHPVLRPGSLLTEPGPDIMIFGLKSACDIMLAWVKVLRAPPALADARNVWIRRNVDAHDLIGHMLSCIDAMTQLGRLSAFAESTANIYQHRLDALRRGHM